MDDVRAQLNASIERVLQRGRDIEAEYDRQHALPSPVPEDEADAVDELIADGARFIIKLGGHAYFTSPAKYPVYLTVADGRTVYRVMTRAAITELCAANGVAMPHI